MEGEHEHGTVAYGVLETEPELSPDVASGQGAEGRPGVGDAPRLHGGGERRGPQGQTERLPTELESEQLTPDWAAGRRGKLTASCAGEVLRMSGAYIRQIRRELAGECEEWTDRSDSAATAWGRRHEPMAVAGYELLTGHRVRKPGLIVHPDLPFVAASVDGLVDGDGMLEVKCPYNPDVHLVTMALGIPDEHEPQVQWGLWVLSAYGVEWCDFVSFDPRQPPPRDTYIQRVPRDEKMIAKMDAVARRFWRAVNSEEDDSPVHIPELF